jgi:PmbA protein
MSQFEYTPASLSAIASEAIKFAKKQGASDAVVNISEGFGLSVNVRLRQVETVELMRDKGLGITVYCGLRRGNASTSDFSREAIERTIFAARDIANFTAEDDCAGLPDPNQLATDAQTGKDLSLYHPWLPETAEALKLATRIESAALDYNSEIANSEGAGVSAYQGQFVLATSAGFCAGYPYSRHSYGVAPIAKRNQEMQREGWYSSARRHSDLADPEALGIYAAQRALSRLGARRIPTGKFPVIFEAPLACGLIGNLVQATSGGALYRKTSFLLDALGKKVFADHVDVFEDPFAPGAFGSSIFDDEGVATCSRSVIEQGVLNGYFLGTYSARKLGMKTTGNAGGAHNLSMTSRRTKPDQDLNRLLQLMGTGFLVTEVMGQGVNYVTGDYSRGASGYWVENGQIQYAVEEVTIAGNLKDIFLSIAAIGTDILVRGTKSSGSVLIEQMSIAGE